MEIATVPATYDLAWSVAVLLVVPLTVLALLRWRARTHTRRGALLWLLVVLLLPGLGAAVYLAVSASAAARGDEA